MTDISRRLGITFVPESMFSDAATLAVAARCVVVRAEFRYDKQGVEQLAVSPDYDVVPLGAVVPQYAWHEERDGEGAIVRVWPRRATPLFVESKEAAIARLDALFSPHG